MDCENLDEFWAQNKQAIGQALPRGIDALAEVLQPSAEVFRLIQQVQGTSVQWVTQEGKMALMFCAIPDPRDLDHILDSYEQVKECQPISETYPFKECDDERTPVDDRARAAAEALKRARDAEAAGLDVLAELIGRLT